MRFLVACAAALAAMSNAAFAQTLAQTPDVTAPPRVEPAPGQTQADLLPAVIEHSRRVATLANGRLGGEGGDFLRALGQQSQFVLIGADMFNIARVNSVRWLPMDGATTHTPWFNEVSLGRTDAGMCAMLVGPRFRVLGEKQLCAAGQNPTALRQHSTT